MNQQPSRANRARSKLGQSKLFESNAQTKDSILGWIRGLLKNLPDDFKIESLGDGSILCRIINHYSPRLINQHRIIHHPQNQYQNTLNLKLVQNAFAKMNWLIPFQISSVCKQKFQENWNLINILHSTLDKNKSFIHSHLQKTKSKFQAQSHNQLTKLDERKMHMECNNLKSDEMMSSQSKWKSTIKSNEECSSLLVKSKTSHQDILNGSLFHEALLDRSKEILLSGKTDCEKIRELLLLMGLEAEVVKVEEVQVIGQKIID